MAAVTLLVAARADFDAAFDWYAARSESAALGFDEEVQACFDASSVIRSGLPAWMPSIVRPA
jgi:plasmid stabilization system protein ParE